MVQYLLSEHGVLIFPAISYFVQLGQKQKELDRLQKQNNILKEQLEDALGREQNAREGYVLQVGTMLTSVIED